MSTVPHGSNYIYDCDDFLTLDWSQNAGSVAKWLWSMTGSGTPNVPNWQTDHPGLFALESGATANSGSALWSNSQSGTPLFSTLKKAVVRWVGMGNLPFGSASFEGEWAVGFRDQPYTTHEGALISYAPGFTAAGGISGAGGILIGVYKAGVSLYQNTTFQPAPGTWYDFIISWTPTAVKFYAAPYGQSPQLLGTITTGMSTAQQYLMAFSARYQVGNANNVWFYVDRAEWLYQTSQSGLYLGDALANY